MHNTENGTLSLCTPCDPLYEKQKELERERRLRDQQRLQKELAKLSDERLLNAYVRQHIELAMAIVNEKDKEVFSYLEDRRRLLKEEILDRLSPRTYLTKLPMTDLLNLLHNVIEDSTNAYSEQTLNTIHAIRKEIKSRTKEEKEVRD